jgi:hypothetical protein
MDPILASLDAKIAELQNKKLSIQDAINRKVAVQKNTTALEQVNAHMETVQQARIALFDDCCGASCSINWDDA